ncbi:MAG: hypothetical protein ACK55K_04165 [Bacteroidota bacterium]
MKEDFLFEEKLKERADKFRMHPSEKVWTHVQASLRSDRITYSRYILILVWTSVFMNICFSLKEMNNFPAPKTYNKSITREGEGEKDIINAKRKLAHKEYSKGKIITHIDLPVKEIVVQETIQKKNTSYLSAIKKPEINSALFYSRKLNKTGSEITARAESVNKDYKLMDKLKEKIKKISYNKSIQFYFTPSLSYRVLYIDNRPYFRNNGAGIESSVSHYPATGLETGVSLLKPITKRWILKTGLQLNFSRYNINASKTTSELVYVTLSQNNGFERNTNIRNGGGLLPKKLMNENLQISLPIGMEFMAAGNEKLSLNISGTIQPSISLYAGGYMVTTNFKNYIPADNLFRRYNVQTGIELFVKTNIGMIDLQAGPQVRYQALSNTIGEYPIREHLIDYGFKVGVVKKIQ